MNSRESGSTGALHPPNSWSMPTLSRSPCIGDPDADDLTIAFQAATLEHRRPHRHIRPLSTQPVHRTVAMCSIDGDSSHGRKENAEGEKGRQTRFEEKVLD